MGVSSSKGACLGRQAVVWGRVLGLEAASDSSAPEPGQRSRMLRGWGLLLPVLGLGGLLHPEVQLSGAAPLYFSSVTLKILFTLFVLKEDFFKENVNGVHLNTLYTF